MSKETLQHLNTNTLIGFTDHRGHAWHYRAEEQGDEPNHYPGPIPIEDVQRRLFAWTAESRRVAVELPAGVESMTHLDDQGVCFEVHCALAEDFDDYCPRALHRATVQAINAYSRQMATTRGLSTWEWIDDTPTEQFAEAIYTSEEFAAAYTEAVETCDRCRL